MPKVPTRALASSIVAILHRASITPSKAELIATWAPTRAWGPPADDPITMVGAFRFDDPDGRVGMETHLVSAGGVLFQIPLTYRDEPLEGADDAFIVPMEHSVLGTRWVYDGLGDPLFVVMLAAVTMTGQGEALGMARFDGRWFIAPSGVRLVGGGWSGGRVAVDGFVYKRQRDAMQRARGVAIAGGDAEAVFDGLATLAQLPESDGRGGWRFIFCGGGGE